MNKAILILLDGCRPDAINPARTPGLSRLMEQGAYSLDCRTVNPSMTLPAHFSLFTSQDPMDHNVLTNTAQPQPSPAATGIMDIANYWGRSTAAFYSWEHLRSLWTSGSVDFTLCMNTGAQTDHDLRLAYTAVKYLVTEQPDFCFVYLEGIDRAGHASGWMSRNYLNAVETADRAVNLIIERLIEARLLDRYSIVVQSDHGGEGNHHDADSPAVNRILWLATGPFIKRAHAIPRQTSILDSAPTLTRIMGLRPHPLWKGRVLSEIFNDTGPSCARQEPCPPAYHQPPLSAFQEQPQKVSL